jgi:anti-sigma B factor antagonist
MFTDLPCGDAPRRRREPGAKIMEPTTPTIDGSDSRQSSPRRSRHVWLPESQPDIDGLAAVFIDKPDPGTGRRVHGDTAEEFEITTFEHEGVVVVEVIGDVDLATSPWLRQQLLQLLGDQPAGLILGLAQVAFMDASGLGTLAVVDRCARLVDTQFKIAGPRRLVRKVLAITGMDKALVISSSLAEALTGDPAMTSDGPRRSLDTRR